MHSAVEREDLRPGPGKRARIAVALDDADDPARAGRLPTLSTGVSGTYVCGVVADTVLDGARYGACTLRAASLRGSWRMNAR